MSVEPPIDAGPGTPGYDPARSKGMVMCSWGDDPAPMVLAVGKVENSVHLLGYNQLPNYQLVNKRRDGTACDEPGLSWCIEPNYTDPGGVKRMEMYAQYLGRAGDQTTVRRYFMVQLDKATGEPVSTAICGGPGYGASLNVWDSPACPASGRPAVTGLPWGAQIAGALQTSAPSGVPSAAEFGPRWRLGGVRKVDGVLSLMVEVGGQTFYLPATAAK